MISFDSSEKVWANISWEGIPMGGSRNPRNHSAFALGNSAIDPQSSAGQITPHIGITRMSINLCRFRPMLSDLPAMRCGRGSCSQLGDGNRERVDIPLTRWPCRCPDGIHLKACIYVGSSFSIPHYPATVRSGYSSLRQWRSSNATESDYWHTAIGCPTKMHSAHDQYVAGRV